VILRWQSLTLFHIRLIPAAPPGNKPFWRFYWIEENWLRITFLYFPPGLENKKMVLFDAMARNALYFMILYT